MYNTDTPRYENLLRVPSERIRYVEEGLYLYCGVDMNQHFCFVSKLE